MNNIRVAEGCSRCPALVANRRCIVHGYGATRSDLNAMGAKGSTRPSVFFIGEAPGYKGGDLTGVPFTRDRSGVRLQRMLIDLGLSLETDPRAEQPRLECFISNVVRCNPPANRRPARTEVANCLPFLWQEMEVVQPEIVVPLGNVAAGVIFPQLLGEAAPPITQAHAQVYTGGAITVVPMRHPARISNADLARFAARLGSLLRSQPR